MVGAFIEIHSTMEKSKDFFLLKFYELFSISMESILSQIGISPEEAQSCLETGNFGFSGSAVTLDQNNFCGMGVTSNGMK